MVELRQVGEHGEAVGAGAGGQVLHLQQRRDPQRLLRHAERQAAVPEYYLVAKNVTCDKYEYKMYIIYLVSIHTIHRQSTRNKRII